VAAVLVHIDLDGDRPHASSLVALAAGRQLASSWGATLYAALIAHNTSEKRSPDSTAQVVSAARVPGIEAIQSALAHGGADKVVVAMTDGPVAPLWAAIGSAWQGAVDHLRPRLVLFGADAPSADELASRTAARIGARLLMRARAVGYAGGSHTSRRAGGDELELRDRDGGYVRMADSGAAVALIARAQDLPRGDDDIDLVMLAMPGFGDPHVDIAASMPAEIAHTRGSVIVLGDDVAGDAKIVADATRLATLLGGQLVGGPAAARALPASAVVDRTTPLAPDLCVLVGNAHVDLAGATSVIRIGAQPNKSVDGALPGPAGSGLAELLERLERP
jgi:electron transfer flavoprotein alpha subunit